MAEEVKKLEKKEAKGKENFRYIVRIVNKDLDGNISIYRALMGLKGVGHRFSHIVSQVFENETGISSSTSLGDMPEEMDKKLEEIVLNPEKHGVPQWVFNRRKDFDSGKTVHLLMNDLDFSYRQDFQRLMQIKSYRGLRHSWGLPTRGQKTKSSFRKRGAVVGVMKKELKPAAAAKK